MAPAGAKAAVEGHEPTFVDMDPPQHTKIRQMFEFAFTPEEAERMKPGIQHKADELIDALKLGRWEVIVCMVFVSTCL
jgi:nitric oxide reductase